MKNTNWLDMLNEYKKSLRAAKKSGNQEIVNDLGKTIREIKGKIENDYNSISVGDIQDPIYSLTDRQKEILLLRKDNTYREIAEKLNLDIRNVFESCQKAAKRIIKIKHDELAILTKKQREIYDMREKAMKYQQIAEKLNISLNSVKSHIKEINKKIKRVRKLHDFS
ncbi:hypothetical protein JYT99_01850 [bacterium AH-315-E09]|nr:hypothetical protein [Alkaliphilus sp. AH-315-G20]MBN4074654.1 hypothetical protein [bacterium AH-315-E09]